MKKIITFFALLLLPLSVFGSSSFIENENLATLNFIDDTSEIDFEFYPNPSTGKIINLKITGTYSGELELRIYSLIGSIVYEKKIMGHSNENFSTRIILDRQLPQGIYLLSVTTKKASITKKLRVHY